MLAVLGRRLYNNDIAPVAQWIEQWPPEPCAGVRFPSGARERQEEIPGVPFVLGYFACFLYRKCSKIPYVIEWRHPSCLYLLPVGEMRTGDGPHIGRFSHRS